MPWHRNSTVKVSKLTLLDKSEKAIKVVQAQARNTKSKEVWLPLSQISYQRKLGRDAEGNQEIVVEIPAWLQEAKLLDAE